MRWPTLPGAPIATHCVPSQVYVTDAVSLSLVLDRGNEVNVCPAIPVCTSAPFPSTLTAKNPNVLMTVTVVPTCLPASLGNVMSAAAVTNTVSRVREESASLQSSMSNVRRRRQYDPNVTQTRRIVRPRGGAQIRDLVATGVRVSSQETAERLEDSIEVGWSGGSAHCSAGPVTTITIPWVPTPPLVDDPVRSCPEPAVAYPGYPVHPAPPPPPPVIPTPCAAPPPPPAPQPIPPSFVCSPSCTGLAGCANESRERERARSNCTRGAIRGRATRPTSLASVASGTRAASRASAAAVTTFAAISSADSAAGRSVGARAVYLAGREFACLTLSAGCLESSVAMVADEYTLSARQLAGEVPAEDWDRSATTAGRGRHSAATAATTARYGDDLYRSVASRPGRFGPSVSAEGREHLHVHQASFGQVRDSVC